MNQYMELRPIQPVYQSLAYFGPFLQFLECLGRFSHMFNLKKGLACLSGCHLLCSIHVPPLSTKNRQKWLIFFTHFSSSFLSFFLFPIWAIFWPTQGHIAKKKETKHQSDEELLQNAYHIYHCV